MLFRSQFVLIHQTDFKKNKVQCSGTREPSSETLLHASLYNTRKEIKAIFHGHCNEILVQAEKLNVKITQRISPYGTSDLINSVLEIVGNDNFIVIKEHGFLAMHTDIEKTGNLCLEMLRQCIN